MLNQQKIQFFNSQSSFGSQSNLANSRYFDLTDQISEQTDTIFMTLQKQFLPTLQLTNFEKIQYLINRANIIANDTLPEHIQYLQKVGAPQTAKDSCRKDSQKLKKLLSDFKNLRNGTMIHKQFYNIYGRDSQNHIFFKKQIAGQGHANQLMSPQVVEFVQKPLMSRVKQYKVSARGGYGNASKVQTCSKDKQYRQLTEQITNLKRRQHQLKKQSEIMINNQRLNCEKRIKIILNMVNKHVSCYNISQEETLNTYKNQLTNYQSQMEGILESKQELMNRNSQLEDKLTHMQRTTQMLQDELNGYRKLENSRMSDFDEWANRSFQSEKNDESGSKNDNKKLNQMIKKLTGERDLLRTQLIKERDSLYAQKSTNEQDKSRQVARLRGYLDERNKEIQHNQRFSDKLRVDIIQLKQENKQLRKQLEGVKQNNQSLKHKYPIDNYSVQSTNLEGSQKYINFNKKNPVGSLNQQSLSAMKVHHFGQYSGQGIEGYPYYELLPRQFRVRFRRSCLKHKQLLHKSNGLQIGVITDVDLPNIGRILVHITNYSDHNITNLKIKAINPNDNRLELDIDQVKILSPNQQLKIPIKCVLKNYPIGPVVLVLDYMAENRHDLRLLLPIHIFKFVTINTRTQKMLKPIAITVKTEKKIVKELATLKQYFNCQGQSNIKVKIFHPHSHSSLYLDLSFAKDHLEMTYQHIEGFVNFTEYFIKTVKTLFEKQQ